MNNVNQQQHEVCSGMGWAQTFQESSLLNHSSAPCLQTAPNPRHPATNGCSVEYNLVERSAQTYRVDTLLPDAGVNKATCKQSSVLSPLLSVPGEGWERRFSPISWLTQIIKPGTNVKGKKSYVKTLLISHCTW